MLKKIELFVVILLLSGLGYTKDTMKWPAPTQQIIEIDRRAGRWYMSETGKAVYCYGPVVRVGGLLGDLRYYATDCKGKERMVRLHE